MKRYACLLIIFLLAISPMLLQARIINVPGEVSTVKGGIYLASNGDTVMIAQGIYYEWEIDFLGKAITVMSSDPGAPNVVDSTIIDANGMGRVFYFHTGESLSSVVDGITITGGHTDYWGGGIWCYQSSPTIKNNNIKANIADYGGGGIFCEESAPAILNNTIMGNQASWGGGGIRCSSSSPAIIGNIITGNSSDYGGGIDCHYSSNPVIINNYITQNSAIDAGGIYCYDFSSPTISYNTITENTADFGGGMHCRYYSCPTLFNNTFVGNTATVQGGGIRCKYSSSVSITNTIFWENNAPVGNEIYVGDILSPDPSVLTISYSDVEGGLSSVYYEMEECLVWGNGMIASDPVFVLPEKQDFRLLWESPCIDTGHPEFFDADLTRRDIGANYFNQNLQLALYLTPDSTKVTQGGQLGVTYTVVNRWSFPESFVLETEVTLPNGMNFTILGPLSYLIPAEHTAQVHVNRLIPPMAPAGDYIYRSWMELPGKTIPGEDSFKFCVAQGGAG
jgi:predicted outer membrane repeat protein